MKLVQREELLDYQTYSERRNDIRSDVMEIKKPRRIHVGQYLTFLFENADTIRYQIQEMMRVERIVREADIQHEIDTYNELLGAPGELGCTMLIEIDDPAERDAKLREWLGLPEAVYLELDDGTRVAATVDDRQQDGRRVSSVQYLTFPVDGRVPVAVGTDFEGVQVRVALTTEQRSALAEDLATT